MSVCVASRLSGCCAACFVRLHDSRYTNGELQYMPMHGPVCKQVCAGVNV